MKGTKLILTFNAALGPALAVLVLGAWSSADFKSLVARDDGGVHGLVAITLAIAMTYSLVFQLWLVKLSAEPHMRKLFGGLPRR